MGKPRAGVVAGSLLLCLIAIRAGAQPLAERIAALAARPPFDRAIWGIVVEDEGRSVYYGRNPNTLLMPASNRKLFTAAAVASCIGFDHQFSTELWLDGDDVILRGGGDPSLGGRYAFDRDAVFKPFIDALRTRGIAEIKGDVVADASLFDRSILPAGWEWDDLFYYYAVPVDALAYNENVVGVMVDDCAKPVIATDPKFIPATAKVTCAAEKEPAVRAEKNNAITIEGEMPPHHQTLAAVSDPALYTGQAFAHALRQAGIRVRGSVRVNGVPRAWSERIASISSPFVSDLLAVVLKPSQNLYAETLLKNLSAEGPPASYAASLDAERRFLIGEVGLADGEFRFQDGSGLSSHDLVTAGAVVKLLRWMDHPSRRGAWWQLLATPGEEGTLRRRLLPLAARVRGKTGSISGVNSLSGIVRGANGGTRYFSIVLNHHLAGSGQALRTIDAMASAIADF
ncbi:MAG: D-alanyl-D-alanine carboxypeptidase/D-alanyl-D-alanine-endopeptidase [Acidobacteriota bacterium]